MNMLRVWGGGYYEDNTFYGLCDRYGIRVCQDFIYACAAYRLNNPEFRDNVLCELKENLHRLRHHACLVLWCGNNENDRIEIHISAKTLATLCVLKPSIKRQHFQRQFLRHTHCSFYSNYLSEARWLVFGTSPPGLARPFACQYNSRSVYNSRWHHTSYDWAEIRKYLQQEPFSSYQMTLSDFLDHIKPFSTIKSNSCYSPI